MESKRRGLFSKSKLVKSLYNRGTKPSSTTVLHPHNGKRNKLVSDDIQKINKPKDPSFSTTDLVIVNQLEQVYPQPQLAFVVPGRKENIHGFGVEDEAVDTKAARYISEVQERFRVECVKLEEMQLI